MCINPTKLPDGQRVACRYCWVCRKNQLEALVGRAMSEAYCSSRVDVVTLTYGGDTPHAHYLVTSDVQKMIKRIRRAGHKVRYLGAGEYGDRKGRAHWHFVLFWGANAPVRPPLRQMTHWKFWPHGHVFFDEASYASVAYAVKYVLKSWHGTRRGQLRRPLRSLKPPLGWRFHMRRADDLVAARGKLQSPEYTVPGVRDKKGEVPTFWLDGRLLEIFLDRYQIMWMLQYGEHPPWTDFFVEYLDAVEREVQNGKMVGGPLEVDSEAEEGAASASRDDRHDAGKQRDFFDSGGKP